MNKTNLKQIGVSASGFVGRRRPNGRAMALVGTMLILMLILASALIGFAKMNKGSSGDLGSTSSNTMQMTTRRMQVMQAENLADAGLRAGVQWISELSAPPLNTTAFTPLTVTPNEFYAGSQRWDSNKWTYVNFPNPADPAKGQFRVRFYPHTDNAAAAQRAYLVECVGTYQGVTRVVRADIRQKNFAQYAYFTDNAPSSLWIAGLTTFNGPVHINNSDNKDINIVWDTGDTNMPLDQARLFQWDGDNSFTMWSNGGQSNNKVKWKTAASNDYTTSPTSAAQWSRIIKPKNEGTTAQEQRTGPQMLADKVEMPTTSEDQLKAALSYVDPTVAESSSTDPGVYVPVGSDLKAKSGAPTGGVYIKGVVDDMVLAATGTNKTDQVVYIYQGANYTTPGSSTYGKPTTKWVLTMRSNGTTKLEKYTRTNDNVNLPFQLTNASGYPNEYSGATNGVIYSRDDIGYQGIETVVNNKLTITRPRLGGISGTIANSVTDSSGEVTEANHLTIVTRAKMNTDGSLDTNNSSEINIDGNLLYANVDKNASSVPETQKTSGILGLVSAKIRMNTHAEVVENGLNGALNLTGFASRPVPEDGAYDDAEAITNMSVHATLMAYDAITVDKFDDRDPGDFRLLGGYIAKNGATFGQLVGGTDLATRYNQSKGFRRILNYDRRVANTPPPFFPGTGQTYEVISYQRVLTPLQN